MSNGAMLFTIAPLQRGNMRNQLCSANQTIKSRLLSNYNLSIVRNVNVANRKSNTCTISTGREVPARTYTSNRSSRKSNGYGVGSVNLASTLIKEFYRLFASAYRVGKVYV